MNINDIEKVKDKIREEYNNNCSKIDELKEKIWLLQRSGFEMKFSGAFVLSIIPWVIIVFLSPSILKLNIIPLELIKPLFIGVPVLIGTAISSIINKKQKINEKVKEFSNAKTNKEKLEEETRYKLEKEKLISYNQMLKKNYEDLKSNEKLVSSLKEKYNIVSKENDIRNKEIIEENVEKEEKLLKESKNNMDIATTRYALSDLFMKERSKLNKYDDAFLLGVMGSLVGMMTYNLPMIMAKSIENVQFNVSLLNVLAPPIIGCVTCVGYGLKRTKDRSNVFKKINSELKENALPEISKLNEEKYEQEKDKLINDTCIIKMQLEIDKEKLEKLKTHREQILDLDYKVPKLTKQPVGEIRRYYLDNEFEKKSYEVLNRDLPNEENVKKKVLINK